MERWYDIIGEAVTWWALWADEFWLLDNTAPASTHGPTGAVQVPVRGTSSSNWAMPLGKAEELVSKYVTSG